MTPEVLIQGRPGGWPPLTPSPRPPSGLTLTDGVEVRLEAVPPVSRPGDLNPGTTYQVVGLGPRRAPLLKHPTCPLSPFVGPQLELATLWALLRRVDGGQGQADLPFYFPGVAAALGAVHILVGCVADAVPLLTQAMQQTMGTDMVGFQARCRLSLEEAHALAEGALAHTREHQKRGEEAWALQLLGEIHSH